MVLSVIIAALAACGLFLVAWALMEALFLPQPKQNAFYVVRLSGDAGQVQQTARACLRLRERRGLRCRLVFVDSGIDNESLSALQLLMQGQNGVTLCAPAQLLENIQWENEEIGIGAD